MRFAALALLTVVVGLGFRLNAPAETPLSSAPLFPVAISDEFPNPQRTFEEVHHLILERYYSDTIDGPSLYHAAIKGMLAHVSPPENKDLAALWSESQYQLLLDALQGVSSSIGVKSTLNQNDASLTVTEVQPGSPAMGVLEPYDRILRIDGESLKGLSPSEVNNRLSGKNGSLVKLKVVRDVEVLNLQIRRESFKVSNITSVVLPENIAFIRIHRITTDVSQELARIINDHQERGISKTIIDLRNNTGGVFAEGMRLAELFVAEKGVIARTRRRGENPKTYVSTNPQPFWTSLILMVNGRTASASEIFAAAIKAHGIGRVVGEPTFGKAIMEETFKLENGFRVKFIVGTLLDPRGNSWQNHGISPDIRVAMNDEHRGRLQRLPLDQLLRHDPQLHAAWSVLR